MSARELILLSPYRLPTQTTLYLGDDEVAALLNGYAALWHPAALQGALTPPRLSSPYDHEQPVAGHLYAVPENPPLAPFPPARKPRLWSSPMTGMTAFGLRGPWPSAPQPTVRRP